MLVLAKASQAHKEQVFAPQPGCRLPTYKATEDMLVLAKAFQAHKEQVLAP